MKKYLVASAAVYFCLLLPAEASPAYFQDLLNFREPAVGSSHVDDGDAVLFHRAVVAILKTLNSIPLTSTELAYQDDPRLNGVMGAQLKQTAQRLLFTTIDASLDACIESIEKEGAITEKNRVEIVLTFSHFWQAEEKVEVPRGTLDRIKALDRAIRSKETTVSEQFTDDDHLANERINKEYWESVYQQIAHELALLEMDLGQVRKLRSRTALDIATLILLGNFQFAQDANSEASIRYQAVRASIMKKVAECVKESP